MAQNYPGLIIKGTTYYFRLAIPRKFWEIAKCREIAYSLNTGNFREAVSKWRTEITHMQTFLNVFEEIIMKINKDNKLVLTETDVDKVLLYRLGQIQHFLEENTTAIEEGKKTFNDVKLYSPEDKKKNPDKVRNLMIEMIINYIKGLVSSNQANETLRTIYTKLKNKEVEMGLVEKDENGNAWFQSFSTHVGSLEKYAKNAVNAVKKDRSYSPSNPKVKTLLRTYDSVKSIERINRSVVSTPWTKLFKRFEKYKKQRKNSSERCISDNHLALELCFGLIKREFVEDVTKQDCRLLSERVYRVPLRWHEKVTRGARLMEILTDNRKKALARKTINRALHTFKEFMRYAAREDIIPYSLNEFVDTPFNLDGIQRTPFTNNELRRIFNPATYVDPKCKNNQAKFWVPIIGLYHGCRLNEICQLDVDDIVKDKGIPCISINTNAPDKHIKHKCTARLIPLHPKLIEMGFLVYVNYQRKHQSRKLFPELSYLPDKNYCRKVQAWFAYYLDKLKMSEREKVFHSFRHTFACKAIEKKIPTEYQNALGGWSDQGVGQRIYGGHKKDTKIMLEELEKITYPITDELKVLAQNYQNTYVFKYFDNKLDPQKFGFINFDTELGEIQY